MVSISVFMITFSPYLSVLAMLIVIVYAKNKKLTIENNKLNINILVLFLWSSFSGFINKNIYSIIASFIILLFLLFSAYLQRIYTKEDKVDKLLHKVVIFTMGSAVIALIEKVTLIHKQSNWFLNLFGIHQFQFGEFTFSPRVTGTFGNQNVAGTWYGIVIFISFYLFMKNKDKNKNKNIYMIASILCLIVLIFTESRGAIFGVVAVLVYYYIAKGNRERAFVLSLLLAAIILLCFERPELFPRGDVFYDTLFKRMYIWKGSFNIFIKKPITGCGLLGIYFDKSVNKIHAHNILLTVATTMGIVGLGIFLNIIINAFKEIMILRRNNSSISLLFGSILVFNFAQGVVDCTIYSPQAGIIFFACLALLHSIVSQYEVESEFSLGSISLLKFLFNFDTRRKVNYPVAKYNNVTKISYLDNNGN